MSADNKIKYKQFAEEKQLPVFFQPWWLDAVSNKWDVVIAEKQGNILAVWPYTFEKKLHLSLIRNPLLTPYSGPLFFLPDTLSSYKRISLEEKLISEMMGQFPKWDFMEVMTLPGFNNFLPFHHCGFTNTQRITYHLDITQPESILWANIQSKQKYAIKKAQEILHLTDAYENVKLLYQMHRNTLESKGEKHPYPENFFNKIIDVSQKQNASYCKAASTANGTIAAIAFCVYDATAMYLLLTATNKNAKYNGAVALLIWDAILAAKEKGLQLFDFEGSMDKGIEGFFRSFGGQRKNYLNLTCNKSNIWKLRELLRS